MRNYIATAVVISGIILAAAYFLRPEESMVSREGMGSGSSSQSIPSSQDSPNQAQISGEQREETGLSQNMIVYTDAGFSPKTLTVKVGDTVTFKNESSRGMWVASAPHPVHTDYPEFDAKKSYGSGETYQFVFQKTGTWKFHNHSNPTDFGSVTVQ